MKGLYAVYTSLNRSVIHTVDCPNFRYRKRDLLPDNYWHRELYQSLENALLKAEDAAKRGARKVWHAVGCKRCGTFGDIGK